MAYEKGVTTRVSDAAKLLTLTKLANGYDEIAENDDHRATVRSPCFVSCSTAERLRPLSTGVGKVARCSGCRGIHSSIPTSGEGVWQQPYTGGEGTISTWTSLRPNRAQRRSTAFVQCGVEPVSRSNRSRARSKGKVGDCKRTPVKFDE